MRTADSMRLSALLREWYSYCLALDLSEAWSPLSIRTFDIQISSLTRLKRGIMLELYSFGNLHVLRACQCMMKQAEPDVHQNRQEKCSEVGSMMFPLSSTAFVIVNAVRTLDA